MSIGETVSAALRRPLPWWSLATNAIPVFGVLFFGWGALPLMVFYWMENVTIGALNVVKIFLSGVTKEFPQPAFGFFLSVFFVLHYGLFCFVHGIFVFAIFTFTDLIEKGVMPEGDTFDLLQRVQLLLASDGELRVSAIVLVIVLVLEFVVFWLGGQKWREKEPREQMFEPYGRVVVLHTVIVFGSIPVLFLGQPVLAVLLLALLKTGLEIGLPMFQVDKREVRWRED